MNKLLGYLVFIVGASFAIWFVWTAVTQLTPYAWRQKLTLVVETPDGIKTGSAVTEVTWTKNHFFKDGGAWWTKVVGEAAFVELGEGKYVFATINNDFDPRMAPKLVSNNPYRESFDEIYRRVQNVTKPTPIQPDDYPLLVTFEDIEDPASVTKVTSENFEELFGDGYALKEINLVTTTNTITNGHVTKVLEWFEKVNGTMLDGSRYVSINAENKLANKLQISDFVRKER